MRSPSRSTSSTFGVGRRPRPARSTPTISGRRPSWSGRSGGKPVARHAGLDLGAVAEPDPGEAAVARHQLGRRQRHRRRADEARDEGVGRAAVDLHRRADLLDAPVVHDDDPVGQRHRLGLVVGDHDHRRVDPLAELGELDPGAQAQRRVEVGQAARRAGTAWAA